MFRIKVTHRNGMSIYLKKLYTSTKAAEKAAKQLREEASEGFEFTVVEKKRRGGAAHG